MRNFTFLLISSFIFLGCSFQTPPNQWQSKSASAYNSYTKNYLSDNDSLAKNDIQRAIAHAKNSADLQSLAQIYLGECALHISVGEDDNCSEYQKLQPLVQNPTQQEYFKLLQHSLDSLNTEVLPKQYRAFAEALKDNDIQQAQEELLSMKPITSQLIAAALIQEKLDTKTLQHIIKNSSYYGYKKSVLYWLNVLAQHSECQNKKSILQKIKILQSK